MIRLCGAPPPERGHPEELRPIKVDGLTEETRFWLEGNRFAVKVRSNEKGDPVQVLFYLDSDVQKANELTAAWRAHQQAQVGVQGAPRIQPPKELVRGGVIWSPESQRYEPMPVLCTDEYTMSVYLEPLSGRQMKAVFVAIIEHGENVPYCFFLYNGKVYPPEEWTLGRRKSLLLYPRPKRGPSSSPPDSGGRSQRRVGMPPPIQ